MKVCAAASLGAGRRLAMAAASVGVVLLIALPASAGALGQCADESLRSELGSTLLPDCRAYEMVTPPYKEGYSLFVVSYAANGESTVLKSLATLAGIEGLGDVNPEVALYLARRTANGWQLSPLNAPMSKFVGQVALAADAGTGASLWVQHTPGEPLSMRGLYVRRSSGVFDLIGPLTPPEGTEEEASNIIAGNLTELLRVVGTTEDYGHVVFEAIDPRARWPFDKTAVISPGRQDSLYEYSGTGNQEPVLVGVVGGRGNRQLIATCGTTLGSGGHASRYNALSRDGEAIFFTVNPCSPGPAKAEVYARLHGSLGGAGAAETVHVSASQCVTCGEESGKNFEGASEDGRLVYFTSTQKLTSDAVDGTASGTDAASGSGCADSHEELGGCNLYLYDFAAPEGARLRTVSTDGEVLGVVGIAQDGSRVYYVSRETIGAAGENVYGKAPVARQPNLYVYDAGSGKTAFIATLGTGDHSDWLRVFQRSAEVAGGSGQFLLFASAAKSLTPDDAHEGLMQLFEYRAATEGEGGAPELVRVTKGEDGFNEDGNGANVGVLLSEIEGVSSELGILDHKSTTNKSNMATDGRTIFFVTAGQLSPRATSSAQGCPSLYEFHSGTALSEASVYLVSDGRDTQLFKGAICGPQFQGMDAAGTNVLFTASDALLPSDVDGGQRDVYDARIEGGFPPPPEVESCGAGLCAGPSSAPPLPVAGSASANGEAPIVSIVGKIGKKGPGSASKLKRALRVCKSKPRARRARCERTMRRKFGSKTAGVLGVRRSR